MKKVVSFLHSYVTPVLIILIFMIEFFFLLFTMHEFKKIKKEQLTLFAKIEEIDQYNKETTKLIFEKIHSIQSSSNRQFSETKKMKENYDLLLVEEKKSRIDSVSKDTAAIELLEKGKEYLKLKNYKEAYEKFMQVLEYQPDNNDARISKIEALYYLNPMDSSKYHEILSDIKVVKNNGMLNPTIINIEELIQKEMVSDE